MLKFATSGEKHSETRIGNEPVRVFFQGFREISGPLIQDKKMEDKEIDVFVFHVFVSFFRRENMDLGDRAHTIGLSHVICTS